MEGTPLLLPLSARSVGQGGDGGDDAGVSPGPYAGARPGQDRGDDHPRLRLGLNVNHLFEAAKIKPGTASVAAAAAAAAAARQSEPAEEGDVELALAGRGEEHGERGERGSEEDAGEAWFIVEGNLRIRHMQPRGLPVYGSQSLEDPVAFDPLPWGSLVRGVDLGFGWLRVGGGEGFLPTRVGGWTVVRRRVPPQAAMAAAAGIRSAGSLAAAAGAGALPAAGLLVPDAMRPRDTCREVDILQFSAPIYYVEEEEGKLVVDIMRIGNLSGRASCTWKTVDASAQAGMNFDAACEVVTFEEGQHLKSVEIGIIKSDSWAATLEFKLQLTDPDNCELGLFLHTARVKLIDVDCFPTNKFREQIESGMAGIAQIPNFALIVEFMKMNFGIPGVKWRVYLTLLLDQMNNLYLYFTLHVTVYFTDVLFAETPRSVSFIPGIESSLLVPDSRRHTAFILAVLYCLPMVLIHFWDYCKVKVDLSGTIRNYLRASLYRKYLNYSEVSRAEIDSSDMQEAIMADVPDASNSFTNAVEVFRITARLVIILTYSFSKNPDSWMILALMPVLMLGWIWLRGDVYLDACNKEDDLQLEVAKFVHGTCESYTIIAEYLQRPQMNEMFAQNLMAATREGRIPKEQVETNNKYFPRWLGPIFVGMYTATISQEVVEGRVSVGTFMATVSVLTSIAGDFGDIYNVLMSYNKLHGPVVNLVHLFNLATDVRDGRAANRARRALTKAARARAVSRGTVVADDAIPIKLVSMSFGWTPDVYKFRNLSMEVQQGTCVALRSSCQAGGRSTLLRLIGQRFQPTSGQVFIPTHLRVLHVSNKCMMINAPIWDNLVFGAKDTSRERVHQILRDLEMDMTLQFLHGRLDDTKNNEGKHRWQVSFPYSELAKIHLARAFIMSPEVCVLQRPFSHFSHRSTSEALAGMIKTMVANRGVRLGGEVHRRRPRTCFFTPEEDWQAELADQVWTIDASGAISSRRGKNSQSPEVWRTGAQRV